MDDAPLCRMAKHSVVNAMGVQPGAIGNGAHGGVKTLQIGRPQFLNRNRADVRADVLAKQLLIPSIGFVADVGVGPVLQPALGEFSNGLPARIDVLAGSDAGDNLGGLLLRLRLRAIQRDVPCHAARRVGREIVLKPPAALAAPCETASHFSFFSAIVD
jgi:hypothetical protein